MRRTMEPQEYFDAGDFVLMRVIQRARGKASGVPVEGEFWFVIAIADGQVTRIEFHTDEGRARAATAQSE
jgi:ketosteroid isomerase-like protein